MYHIVFTPKYRRKSFIINSSLYSYHRLCSYKGVEIIEGHLMLDHVHMLVISTEDKCFEFRYLKVKCTYDV